MQLRVLILSDNAPRRNFLMHHFQQSGMHPVVYPNVGAYALDLAENEPAVLVLDLELPIESKITVAQKALAQYPKLKVITIGKRDYLEAEQLFAGCRNVAMIDELEDL